MVGWGSTAAVTGATGFLGRQIVLRLLRDGYKVRCLVRRTSNTACLPAGEVELVECSLDDSAAAIRRALKGCRLIVHSAAIHNRKLSMREETFKVNVEGTRAVIEGAGSLDAFVFVSSIRSLMTSHTSQINEDTEYDFSEWDTPYGASKFQAEKMCLEYYQSQKLPLYVVNPATIIGPEDMRPSHNGTMVLTHLRRKVGLITKAMIPIVDVRDVADAIPLIVDRGAQGERHIICAANMLLGEFFRMIDRAAGQNKYYITAPYPLLKIAGWGFELLETILPSFEPPVVRSSVKVARLMAEFSGDKLRHLGFVYRDARQTVADTVQWFLEYHKLSGGQDLP